MNKREASPALNDWTGGKLASARWQELHTQLSRQPATAIYGWAHRASMICKWRAAPVAAPAALVASGVAE